jgi:type II secretion system protein I
MCGRGRRSGLSLLEVLVALAIFLISLIGIGRLITFAADRARDVEQQALAIQMCESKLAEAAAGALTLGTAQPSTPFDEDPSWEWSMDCDQAANLPGLWNVTIHVTRTRPDGSKVEVALSQMVLDPSVRGALPSSSSASSSNSASTGNSSSGSQSSSMGAGPGSGTPSGNSGGGTPSPGAAGPGGNSRPP